ncbi:alcohol dehydrogenase catalytic domain-containing protein [Leifsonia poae]|uniref:alcohol dehydrogenase catalytic domain-containing protein n=1 Tax=Leifsonia poae TaxID=110933 RepID=UPI001CC102BD|nr:zinc-binding dehydrogenase [Leifsonia poae]
MSTSTALTFDRFGDIGALTLSTVADGPLTKNQVRIAVTVAGLNPVDWQIVESPALADAFGISLPSGFGNDFAGVVADVGSAVTRWSVGDRVFGGARGAAVATSVVLEQDHRSLHATPDGVSELSAGVLDIAGRTASAVFDALAVRPGDVVLVGGAAGGVGSILVPLLVRAGATVVGTGSASSFDDLRWLGAAPAQYGPGLDEAVRALAPGGVDAAADLHSTETAHSALRLGVAPRRIVTIEADDPPSGVRAVNGSDARPDALRELTDLIASGALAIPIAATYPLAEAPAAVAFQRRRHAHGKVAIEIGRGSATTP